MRQISENMKRRNFIFSILLVLTSVSIGCRASVEEKEHQVKITSIKNIGGFVGYRHSLNKDYLKSFPIDRYVDFIVERNHTAWDWTRAEQHGKWMESSLLTAIVSGDKELESKVKSVIKRIIDSQEDSGYLGATARSYRSEERPIRGMDPYELYFVFHALMTAYEQWDDKEALTSAERLADYFLRYFGEGRQEFWPSSLRYPENRWKELSGTSQFAGHSVHYSWEGTLLCDPISRLYSITGKQKYLDWTKWVIGNIDRWSGFDSYSRLDSVADGLIGVDKLQPYVHSHTFHMNFLGFLRMYSITGDKSYLKKVLGAWNDIYNRQMYITGGVSVAEHYEFDYVKPLRGNIIETCASMSWMQLTQGLLQLTGDVKYADAIEKIMLNHVLAAQETETGVFRYHTAPVGFKPTGFFHGPDCCTASGHRVMSLLPQFLYAENGSDFYVNQYIPAEYSGDDFGFTVSGDYPTNDRVVLTITSEKPVKKTLHLRIPGWCKGAEVKFKNSKLKIQNESGTYYSLNRKWKKGDVVEIYLPMECSWVEREHHAEYSTYRLVGGEIMYRVEPAKEVPYAFVRGPLVYSVDMVWNKGICADNTDIYDNLRIDTSSTPVQKASTDSRLLGPFYQAQAKVGDKDVDVTLTPFANTGVWQREGEQRPEPNSKTFAYSIWLKKI